MQATSLAHIDTEYSADCVEFCPFPGYERYFICGTYQVLEPASGPTPSGDNVESSSASAQTNRTGRLLLYRVDDRGGMREVQRIETNAILDAKWCPKMDQAPVLSVADAKGRIVTYRLTEGRLEEMYAAQIADDITLTLSLDYSNRLNSDIIASLSSGSLTHLQPTPTGLVELASWHAHAYEPWIASWDAWTPTRVWSGGDDLLLKSWDSRAPGVPTSITKGFDGGVTTATSSLHSEHLLAVGSYDCNLRLFDARSPRFPLHTIPVPGGVWRTRFHPDPARKNEVLLACMQGGFAVVRLDAPNLVSGRDTSESVIVGERGAEVVKTFDVGKPIARRYMLILRPRVTYMVIGDAAAVCITWEKLLERGVRIAVVSPQTMTGPSRKRGTEHTAQQTIVE